MNGLITIGEDIDQRLLWNDTEIICDGSVITWRQVAFKDGSYLSSLHIIDHQRSPAGYRSLKFEVLDRKVWVRIGHYRDGLGIINWTFFNYRILNNSGIQHWVDSGIRRELCKCFCRKKANEEYETRSEEH